MSRRASADRAVLSVAMVAAGWVLLRPVGVAGTQWGLIHAAVILGVVGAAAARVTFHGHRHHRRLTVALAIVGLGAGVALWAATPPTWSRLDAALDRVELPASAELEREIRAGNTFCFDHCPTLSRTYLVEAPVDVVLVELAEAFREGGFEATHPRYLSRPQQARLTARRPVSRVVVRVQLTERGAHTHVTVTAGGR